MECSITANGRGYEIGWAAMLEPVKIPQRLERAYNFRNTLKPNCFIPCVTARFCLFLKIIRNILKIIIKILAK